MGSMDIVMIIFAVAVAVGAGLYFLNRWATRRMGEQQTLIERTKQPASIYVIDKSKMKATEANLPKAVVSQMPMMYKFLKMPLVKAKVGAQIITLMCDKNVYAALPVKKTVKVELAGMYIISMQGLKSKDEYRKQKSAPAKPWDNILSKIRGK